MAKELTEYIGLDYGLGRTNVDRATGIRFGVISQHSVGQMWYDNSEADYGKPSCPKCGEPAVDHSAVEDDTEDWETAKYECADYACLTCKYVFGGESAYPEEPLGFSFEDSEYTLSDCLQTDIMILRSPYYTYAQYCSPCVPGAGNLDNPTNETGPKTYALGHDWFEDGKAPYRLYRVSDDMEVFPDGE